MPRVVPRIWRTALRWEPERGLTHEHLRIHAGEAGDAVTAALILDDTRQLSAFCLNRKSSACVCLRQAAISKLATVSVENVSYARSVELVQSYDAWPLRQYAVSLVGVV